MVSYKAKVEGGHVVYGTGHMDKAPMVLVHTCGSLAEGETRRRFFRTWDKDTGKYVSEYYNLEQPNVHALYRGNFSKVDTFDKQALGHSSMARALRTRDW